MSKPTDRLRGGPGAGGFHRIRGSGSALNSAPSFLLVSTLTKGAENGGLKMVAGLVWRTILFFGLTAGYAVIAALPYLA